LLGEYNNFYRLNKNKQINNFIFEKMKLFEDKSAIIYGQKANLKGYNIKLKSDKNEKENNFLIEKNLNILMILKLRLFEYKIISRADISTKLAESDMSLEEYLNKLKISKHIMNYYKDFFNCKP